MQGRVTHGINDADLRDPGKRVLYGGPELDREIELRSRQHQGVDLRSYEDEAAPLDDWSRAKRAASVRGIPFDPIAAGGLRCNTTLLGDPFEAEKRRREQVKARDTQRVRWAVSLGSSVTLRDGTTLREGDSLSDQQVNHAHVAEIIGALVRCGAVQAIDPHVAFLRGLDPSIGPYVVVRDMALSNGKRLTRGQPCDADDFPELVRPRVFADGDPIASMTAGELRGLMAEVIYMRVPGAPSEPPPVSDWMRALENGSIELAPNYVHPASFKKGKS